MSRERVGMLNIGRMGPGSHEYYLSVVARGVEDYYLAEGEEPGRWLGRGLEPLGLSGRVEAEQLRAVLAGEDPATGERLAAHPARKVPGFDLTFRAPKSVSLLWGLGDREVADQVVAAHDAAVAAAVGYLEREAVRTRRGAGGTERVEVDGLVAAGFRHRASRAGDPLLHTHVLAANLVRTSDDGVWRTLESRRIFLHAKTAGVLYQAQLRHELTSRLGVAWGPVTNGHADLAGVPRELIEAFSRRRQQIVERLEQRGESSAKAAQVATLETRVAKEGHVSERDLRHAWMARAGELGFDPEELTRLLGRHRPAAPDLPELVDDLVGREELTARRSTFAVRDLLQAVAERLPDGAQVAEVEQTARQVLAQAGEQVVALGARRGQLASVDVIRRADGRVVVGDESEVRLTTRGLLLVEQSAIHGAVARRAETTAVVPQRALARVLARRPTLSDEQATMVSRLVRDGDGVAVVVGRAGTGKTFALDAARAAWQAANIEVRGVALAARAARELHESSGIASGTIHRLLAQIEDPGRGSPLRPGSVLIIDEAGMVGSRLLARVLDHAARQQVKVVLVGDPRQLPEIDAGGLFDQLARRLDVVELTVNRRQQHRWEQVALDQLRHGDPAAALDAYRDHDRIVTADTAEALRETLVTDWWDAYDQLGAGNAVMVALRRADVDDLNHRARLRLRTAGRLLGPPVDLGDERQVQIGDRVLCLRNDRRIGVDNGTLGDVIGTDRGQLQVRTDDGRDLTLPDWYVRAGHVTHGYAITGHKAQGATVDHTFVLGSDLLYREWGYVALSRGRESNRLYVHPALPDPHGIAHGPAEPADPHTKTLAGLNRSAAQQAAVSHLDRIDSRPLAARWRYLRHLAIDVASARDLQVARQRTVDELEGLDTRLAQAEAELDRATTGLKRLSRPRREQRDQLAHRIERLRASRAGTRRRLAQLDEQLAQLPDPGQDDQVRRDLEDARAKLWHAIRTRLPVIEAHPPAYVVTTLGTPPPDRGDRAVWRDAVTRLEAYRSCWHIQDPDRPFGDRAGNSPVEREHRADTIQAVARAVQQLRHEDELERIQRRQRGRGITRGLSR